MSNSIAAWQRIQSRSDGQPGEPHPNGNIFTRKPSDRSLRLGKWILYLSGISRTKCRCCSPTVPPSQDQDNMDDFKFDDRADHLNSPNPSEPDV
ncbi:hypothetical protein KEM48_014253 [Puccinia striiformis f. sp. tritici PST-130]|nr:hypothetical protein KEM48_014253 [Puccinia striiformis f. sp. tritici PST-130]